MCGSRVNLIRCFVAVDVEEPAIVDAISRIQEQLTASRAKLKLVELNNLHLTLKFIGEAPKLVVDEIARALQGVEFSPFRIALAGVGAFPSPRSPRVVWVSVREGVAELAELSGKVNAALVKLRLPKPSEEFTPHLTLARVKGGVGGLPRLLEELASVEVGTMLVDKVKLKKSVLTPRGPIYETIFERGASD